MGDCGVNPARLNFEDTYGPRGSGFIEAHSFDTVELKITKELVSDTAKCVPVTRIWWPPRTSQPLFAERFSLLECLPGQEATYGEA